jgi:hypothetical protein
MPVVFNGGLSVQAQSPIRRKRKIWKGRNINYLILDNRLFLEEWPLPTPKHGVTGRKVSEIDIFDNGDSKRHRSGNHQLKSNPPFKGLTYCCSPPKLAISAKFGALGTACCVKSQKEYYHDLLDPGQDCLPYVLVGISHIKSFKCIQMSQGEK